MVEQVRWWLLVILLLLFAAAGTAAPRVVCRVEGVTLFSDQLEDGEAACEAAGTAIEFMRGHDFRADARLTISVVDRPLTLHGVEVTGTYDSRRFHVEVPDFSQVQLMAQRHPPFRLPMSRALWQSFVVHEVAHAVAHEYIACVAQLAILPEALRDRLLGSFNNAPFQHDREISQIFLELNPEVFAVKAYRHFVAQPQPDRFFQRLLGGARWPPGR